MKIVRNFAFAGPAAAFRAGGVHAYAHHREHKLASRGGKCVMFGISRNFPSDTVKVLNVKTGHIVYR